jgi:hypothetical protein
MPEFADPGFYVRIVFFILLNIGYQTVNAADKIIGMYRCATGWRRQIRGYVMEG